MPQNETGPNQETSPDDMGKPNNFQIIKTFPLPGEWQQYRLAASTKFSCSRCEKSKVSKLVAIGEGKWGCLLCNRCYGLLVSRSSQNS